MQPTIDAEVGGRLPTWSGPLTRPLASLIPPRWRGEALVAIKAIHTVIFASVFAAVLMTLWDGIQGAPRRRTGVAGGIVLTESALYLSNNQVCPLTPLAAQLGAARGSVVDMFLPAALARRIPLVAGSAAILALVLNLRALARRPSPRLDAPRWASSTNRSGS
jgi:hypothetical protein